MRIIFKLILILSCFNSRWNSGFSQNRIGLKIGTVQSKFIDFTSNDYYKTDFPLRTGFSFSFFYSTKVDSVSNFNSAISFDNLSGHLKAHNIDGYDSYYRDLNFTINQLSLEFTYAFKMLNKKSNCLSLTTGPTFFFTLSSESNGFGWEYVKKNQNLHSFYEWSLDNGKNDFLDFRYGWTLGLEYSFSLNKQVDFLIFNSNDINFPHVLKRYDLKYASFLNFKFGIGLSLNIDSK